MKTSIVVVLFIFYSQEIYCQTSGATDLKKLNWLEGTWERTDTKAGRSGHERWTKLSDTELQGIGVNMKGADTSFVEKIKVIVKDGNIFYVADVPENKQEVYFKFTEVSANGFVCENPTHDFPKKIAYVRDGNHLKATISGDGKSIDYLFVKK